MTIKSHGPRTALENSIISWRLATALEPSDFGSKLDSFVPRARDIGSPVAFPAKMDKRNGGRKEHLQVKITSEAKSDLDLSLHTVLLDE